MHRTAIDSAGKPTTEADNHLPKYFGPQQTSSAMFESTENESVSGSLALCDSRTTTSHCSLREDPAPAEVLNQSPLTPPNSPGVPPSDLHDPPDRHPYSGKSLLVGRSALQISPQELFNHQVSSKLQAIDALTDQNIIRPASSAHTVDDADESKRREKLKVIQAGIEHEETANKAVVIDEEASQIAERPFILVHAVLVSLSIAVVIVVEMACAAKVSRNLRTRRASDLELVALG